MTEFGPSNARMAGAALIAVFFIAGAVLSDDFGPVMRAVSLVLGGGLFGALVTIARTRIVVGDDELAIRRFGKWFRADPREVSVRWTPVFNGIGRGNGWALSVGRPRTKHGVTVPLSCWRPATIEALRVRLDEVIGVTPDQL